MKRLIVVCSAIVLFGAVSRAAAQEMSNDGRVEIGVFPGGGTFFTGGSNGEVSFKNYALGASATINTSRHVGVEFEFGAGLGIEQTVDFQSVSFSSFKSPNTMAYNANLVLYPGDRGRSVVGYVTAGAGGMTIFKRDELAAFSQGGTNTFLAENFGGGLKWFSGQGWGARGDYRFVIVNKKDTPDAFFAINQNRYGHRLSGSLLFTF